MLTVAWLCEATAHKEGLKRACIILYRHGHEGKGEARAYSDVMPLAVAKVYAAMRRRAQVVAPPIVSDATVALHAQRVDGISGAIGAPPNNPAVLIARGDGSDPRGDCVLSTGERPTVRFCESRPGEGNHESRRSKRGGGVGARDERSMWIGLGGFEGANVLPGWCRVAD